jgi:hypothetical protein
MKVLDGLTLALYIVGDNSVIEYWHQQFTNIEENVSPVCRCLELDLLRASRGWKFPVTFIHP